MDIPKQTDSKIVFKGKFVQVAEDTLQYKTGDTRQLEKIVVGDGAQIIPFFPNGNVYMLRQYRHAAGDVLEHFPSGYINQDETPEEAAQRILCEEVGHSGKLVPLGTYNPYGGLITARNHFFAATNLSRNEGWAHHDRIEQREMEVIRKDMRDVYRDVMEGRHKEPISAFAFLLAWNKIGLSMF